jgi:transglutaminase-like putative cysteine protease
MEKSPIHDWDWLSAGLLFLMIQAAAGRLVIANWAPFLYFAETLATLGTGLGLALGASRFKRQMAIWIAMDYTVIVLPWQWTVAVQSGDVSFRDQLHIMASQLAIDLVQFFQRAPVNDSFLFIAFISLVMWITGLTAGYWLTRHDNLLITVIPSALVMMIVQVYDNYYSLRSWWLAAYLFLVLLLIGRRYFLRSRVEWKKQHLAVSEDAWLDILNSLTPMALIVISIAWIFPTSLTSLQAASEAWNKISNPVQNRLSNAVVSLQSPYSNGGTDFYSNSLVLGREAAQGNQPVFTVKVLSAATPAMPYYWRGRVYDFYADGQWSNSGDTTLDFQPASQNLNLVNAQNRSEARFQFTMQFPQQRLLYAPSEPVWMDQAGSVSVITAGNGRNDPLAWFANPPVTKGTPYQVRAEIADPTVAELEAAGTNYPAWVQNYYLEVPQNIQIGVQALAEQVTNGRTTPYDQAEAITNYLRSTIQYSTRVPSPPAGEDPTTWVLFDYKKGFCNYYASAEVLMLRSIGVPARMAVGFAEGASNDPVVEHPGSAGTFTVLNRDAHAWPEVYFPGIGWAEFEPTVSQNPIVRPATKAQISQQQSSNTSSNANPNQPRAASNPGTSAGSVRPTPRMNNIAWISISLLLVGLMVLAFRRHRLLNRVPLVLSTNLERLGLSTPAWLGTWIIWNQMTSVERSFASINLSLRWLGKPQPVYATAAERAAELIKSLPAARVYIETVSSEHQSALFARRSADLSRARHAGMMILLHTLRFTVLKFWNAIFNGDVYSG